MGKISTAGNERLRQLLFVRAMSIICFAKPGSKSASAWLLQLLERKPRKLAAVTLATKTARIVWATLAKVPADRLRSAGMPEEGMMLRREAYRRQSVEAASN
jgi:transposase